LTIIREKKIKTRANSRFAKKQGRVLGEPQNLSGLPTVLKHLSTFTLRVGRALGGSWEDEVPKNLHLVLVSKRSRKISLVPLKNCLIV
jgi:hypothetical protein